MSQSVLVFQCDSVRFFEDEANDENYIQSDTQHEEKVVKLQVYEVKWLIFPIGSRFQRNQILRVFHKECQTESKNNETPFPRRVLLMQDIVNC